MMVVIFAGPTITQKEIKSHIDCHCLPPVKHGDILRVLAQKPTAIGIIDGYFEGAPSVWHKEILYALEQGVHVYGSSSMGALRAAELHSFGMVGIGQIFEWYRDGLVTDDDEVAVLHGPEEANFVVASMPMVNIRASLAEACEQGVVNSAQRDSLLAVAKQTFYKRRSWNRLLEESIELFDDRQLTQRLKNWLDHNAIDQKKRDAVQMLTTMQSNRDKHAQKYQACVFFEWTDVWDSAFKRYARFSGEDISVTPDDKSVLDELSLNPDLFERYRDKALLYYLMSNIVELRIDDADLQAELSRFKLDIGMQTRTQVLQYMSHVMLDESRLTELLKTSAKIEQLKHTVPDLAAGIVAQLKLSGRYLDLLHIAQEKGAFSRLIPDDMEHSGVMQRQILSWYFERQLGCPVPQRLDCYIKKTGFESVEQFYRAINIDYAYYNRARC